MQKVWPNRNTTVAPAFGGWSLSWTLSYVFLLFFNFYLSNSLICIYPILWLMHPPPVCHLEANLCHGHFFAEHQSLSPADFFPATILSPPPFDTFLSRVTPSQVHLCPPAEIRQRFHLPAKKDFISRQKRFHLLAKKISSAAEKISSAGKKDFIS